MSEELKWLVLKDSEVLGPFSTSQIIVGIYEGRFKSNNMVSSKASGPDDVPPFEAQSESYFLNWIQLKDIPEFALFDSNEQDYEENTVTQFTAAGSEEEYTYDPEQGHEDSRANIDTADANAVRVNYLSKRKFKLIMNTALVAISLVFLSIIFYKRVDKVSDENIDWYKIGSDQIKIGDYSNAIVSLRRAHDEDPLDIDATLSYAELLIEKEYLSQALGALNEANITNSVQQKRKFNLLGVIALKNKNLDGAKNWFDKALDIDSSYIPALVNSGIVNLLGKRYMASNSKFELAHRIGSRDSVLLMSMFLSATELFNQTQNTKLLEHVKRILIQVLDVESGYEIHYHLALAYLDVFIGNNKAANDRFNNIMMLDPDLEPSHFVHRLDIFKDHVSWNNTYLWVQKYYDLLNDGPEKEAIKAVLEIKRNNLQEAEKSLSNAILSDGENVGIRVLYAYMKMKLGILSETRANIGLVSDANYFPLILLKSKLCEMGVADCSHLFKAMLEHDFYKLQSISGLAQHLIKVEKYSEARELISTGLEISKSYIPLLKLQRQIQNIN